MLRIRLDLQSISAARELFQARSKGKALGGSLSSSLSGLVLLSILSFRFLRAKIRDPFVLDRSFQ